MTKRRELLQHGSALAMMLLGAGLLPATALGQTAAYRTAAFDSKSMAEVMKALGAAAPTESADVKLSGPDIAENGAVVPLGVSTTLAGVKSLLLLVEKNPNMLSAMFEISETIEPSVSTRVKMSESSNVYAVAMMNDGRVLYARKDVKVTLGGCGG